MIRPIFFPYASDDFRVQAATDVLSADSAAIRLRKVVKKISGDWPREISGVLITGDRQPADRL